MVGDIIMYPQSMDTMNGKCTIICMMNTVVEIVRLADIASNMLMDRISTEEEPLASLSNFNIRQTHTMPVRASKVACFRLRCMSKNMRTVLQIV